MDPLLGCFIGMMFERGEYLTEMVIGRGGGFNGVVVFKGVALLQGGWCMRELVCFKVVVVLWEVSVNQ